MLETEALAKMVAPGTPRETKWRKGVIQIHLTRACDLACYQCLQGSNLRGPYDFITLDNFEKACQSLQGYFGVVGCFGGNPAVHPQFDSICDILTKYVPFEQRGIWCNNPITPHNAEVMRRTFNPAHSNLNVHLNQHAYDLFKVWWPESMPFGLHQDSRHSPSLVAMRDVIADEGKRWELISGCFVNRFWSAMVCQFRGELRAFFCEVAGAAAILHQHEADYPDTGLDPTKEYVVMAGRVISVKSMPETGGNVGTWWHLPMSAFAEQVRKHCHECAVPLNGYGELAQAESGVEQTSATHAAAYRPKKKYRPVQVVTNLTQLGLGKIQKMTDYLGNAAK
jgi:hypothetical protein